VVDSRTIVSVEHAQELAERALLREGTSKETARCVAKALVLADCDGQYSHGLSRILSYIGQLRGKKVNGYSKPIPQEISASSVKIDANGGFAYPALDMAVDWLTACCIQHGIGVASISQSHHGGVAGHPVERLARAGNVSLMFANTPKAIPAAGGTRSLLGTNPLAFSCPREQLNPLVIDLSMSMVSRGKISNAAQQQQKIPDTWGVDKTGNPTTDPNEVLKGSLNSFGGEKAAVLAMLIEILAGAFTDSNMGFEASSFFDADGPPPQVGQLLIGMRSTLFNERFTDGVERLVAEIEKDEGTRIPGAKRFDSRSRAISQGIEYPSSLIESLSS